MVLAVWQSIAALLLLACLGSFAWAMRCFFVQPSGTTAGMKLITACGAVFSALHLIGIVLPGGVTAGRGSVAALLYIGSLGLFWWAIRTHAGQRLSAAFSSDSPEHLVENGPYRFIRHPFYCSYLLTWCTGVIATGRLWLAPTVAIMAAIYWRAARIEEAKFSRSPLAEEYQRYRERTAWFFPNPRKLILAWRSQ